MKIDPRTEKFFLINNMLILFYTSTVFKFAYDSLAKMLEDGRDYYFFHLVYIWFLVPIFFVSRRIWELRAHNFSQVKLTILQCSLIFIAVFFFFALTSFDADPQSSIALIYLPALQLVFFQTFAKAMGISK